MGLADDVAAATPPVNMGRMDLRPDGGEFIDIKSDVELASDWSAIFLRFKLNPADFEIVDDTVRGSTWQQSKRLENGDRDVLNLYSYSAQFRRRKSRIDLPALYAEVARTKHRPLKITPTPRHTVVCWADVQTGKVDHLGGVKELLERLDEKRTKLEAHLRKVKPERIVVADVGDIIEGIENVASQLATNGLSLMDQVDVAAVEFWKTIRLCARFAPVDVLSIPSNHAQLRRGKDLIGKPGDDWGIHISKRLEHLNAEARLPVTFHRPSDEWEETLVFTIRGTRLGLAHGHQAGGPDRVTAWWAKLNHAGVMDCDVLLTGHFHFASFHPSGRHAVTKRSKWHIQAPTLDNGSAWVRNKIGEDGDPGLLAFDITDDGFDLTSFSVL